MAERSKVWVLSAAIALLLGLDAVAVAVVEPVAGPHPAGESAASTPNAGDASSDSSSPTAPGAHPDAPAQGAQVSPEGGSQAGSTGTRLGSAALPRAGIYTWRYDGESVMTASSTTEAKETESEDSARYEVLPGPDGDRRVRRHSDYRESKDGDFTMGGSSYSDQAWRPEGVFDIGSRVHSKNTDSSGHSEERTSGCDWDPPIPTLVYPLAEGTEWTWSSTCVDEHDPTMTSTQEWNGTARIEAWESVEIGGQRIEAVRVRYSDDRVIQTSFPNQPPGGFQPSGSRFQSEGLRWFAPSVGLVVRTDTTTVVSQQGGDPENGYEARTEGTSELVSIHPK